MGRIEETKAELTKTYQWHILNEKHLKHEEINVVHTKV